MSMRKKINESGVSAILGFILVFAIILAGIGMVQLFFVPKWVKDDEWNHYLTIRDDFTSIPKLMALTTSSKNPNVVTLSLGVNRGEYPFLLTPPDSGSSLIAKKENIWVNYNETLPNGSVVHREIQLTSSALIAKPTYNYLPETELIYEHSYVFVRSGESGGSATLADQIAFSKQGFTLYILKTNFDSIASGETVSIPLNPISTGGKISVVNATIRFESLNPPYWEKTLKDMGIDVSVSGNNVTVNLANTIMSISVIGLDGGNVNLRYRPYLYVSQIITFVGDTEVVEVIVRDQFGNPVPNVPVNGSTTIGALDSTTKTTDANGIARFVFKATEVGSGKITFESGGNSTSADVTVTEPSGGEPRWSKNRNDTLVISPDFKWTGIYGASEVWLRNADRIGNDDGHMMGDNDFEISFVLYNSSVFYYFTFDLRYGSGVDKVWLWKTNQSGTFAYLDWARLDSTEADKIFSDEGINILDPNNYVGLSKNERNNLLSVKWFLQNATLSDPVSLQVQSIEEGWKVEIQIK